MNRALKPIIVEKLYDLAFLHDYFDDDGASILPILTMYLEETPKELSTIQSSLHGNETAAAKAGTHKIKTNVAMMGIRDNSTFVNDMHLLQPNDEITKELMQQFEQFKQSVTLALQQIQEDFFTK